MDEPERAPAAEFFVARDRARAFGRRIREALREWRLAWKGDRIGMETLVDHGDRALADAMENIATTTAALRDGRLRDRERAYMEVPLIVVAEALGVRIALARRLEAARRLGEVPAPHAQQLTGALLDGCLARIDAWCEAYDSKRPVGPPTLVDLGPLLERVQLERDAARALLPGRGREAPGEVFTGTPPALQSDPHALHDLLTLCAAAAPAGAGPWDITRSEDGGGAATLALGGPGAGRDELAAPEALAEAAEVLAFLHGVKVRCVGAEVGGTGGLLSEPAPAGSLRIDRVELTLGDEDAEDLESLLSSEADEGGTLSPAAERAVRAWIAAPGGLSPQRLVAMQGLLGALDKELEGKLVDRANHSVTQVRARSLPRKKTRKGQLEPAFVKQLTYRFPGIAQSRLDVVAEASAHARYTRKLAKPKDAACLLALLGLPYVHSGREEPAGLKLEPLGALEIQGLVTALIAIHADRSALESGALSPETLERLAHTTTRALATLGRLP